MLTQRNIQGSNGFSIGTNVSKEKTNQSYVVSKDAKASKNTNQSPAKSKKS